MSAAFDVLPADARASLTRLHAASDADMPRIARGFARSLGRRLQPHHMRDAYISIGREQGRWLHDLIVSRGARGVVEFGTSFGISAIWMGAACRHTGGHVTTTEIVAQKAAAARESVQEAGLEGVVTVLEGDALETLGGHDTPIDLLFFDGWADLYPELLELLTPSLSAEAMLVVDNANQPRTHSFLGRVASLPGWTRLPHHDARVAVFERVSG